MANIVGATKIPTKKNIPKNNIPVQSKVSANSLTIQEWNTVINTLKAQADEIAEYISTLHRVLFHEVPGYDNGESMEVNLSSGGLLNDSILRLKHIWDPYTQELLPIDKSKRGWMYQVKFVDHDTPIEKHGIIWSQGDYAVYNQAGILYNFTASIRSGLLMKPTINQDTDTVRIDVTETDDAVRLSAHVRISERPFNDIVVRDDGIHSDAFNQFRSLTHIMYTEPTEDNETGILRIVSLPEAPSQYYNGYLYLIPLDEIIIEK